MRNKVLYGKALEKWGRTFQKLMVIEELSELTHAICKSFRSTTVSTDEKVKEQLIDEVADVEIMLEQLQLMEGIETAVVIKKVEKLKRLEKLLTDVGT